MTEEEARSWVEARFGQVALEQLSRMVAAILAESEHQNLIAASTAASIWSRHVLDSLQLVDLAAGRSGSWLDIGSGGGFPGLAVAVVWPGETVLVEPRRRRAEFLAHLIGELELSDRVSVIQSRVERVHRTVAILSARAVAGIEALFEMAHQCAEPMTRWLLPRGVIEMREIEDLRQRWDFMFHVEHSLASPTSQILVAEGVGRR